jgi:hypothetical protein
MDLSRPVMGLLYLLPVIDYGEYWKNYRSTGRIYQGKPLKSLLDV